MNVNGGTGNAVPIEELIQIEVSRSLRFLIAAMNATDREQLDEHGAYQEALHLFRVLRPPILRDPRRSVSRSESRNPQKT